MVSREVYCTITTQSLSPCGRFLAAGNTYGQLALFNLDKIVNPKQPFTVDGSNESERLFQIEQDGQIFSSATVDRFLVLGTPGEISGREWKSLIESKHVDKPSWRIQMPEERRNFDKTDVNTLMWDTQEEVLYAGCGDNNVYAFDVSQGKLIRTYKGHNDYIHSIHGSNSTLISAGEDGHVKIWDKRSPKTCDNIVPYENDKLSRNDLGKWIGAVSINEDWILCGGGPKLSLWQRRSLSPISVFDLPDHGIHLSYFNEDRIFAGGTAPYLYQLNYSGEIEVELPVSATTVYSTVEQNTPFFCFTIAGSSPLIDLCTNYNYKDQVLKFYSNKENAR